MNSGYRRVGFSRRKLTDLWGCSGHFWIRPAAVNSSDNRSAGNNIKKKKRTNSCKSFENNTWPFVQSVLSFGCVGVYPVYGLRDVLFSLSELWMCKVSCLGFPSFLMNLETETCFSCVSKITLVIPLLVLIEIYFQETYFLFPYQNLDRIAFWVFFTCLIFFFS